MKKVFTNGIDANHKTEMRKVLITDIIHADYKIILTNATPKRINEWIAERNADDDISGDYFKDLKVDTYVKILYDSNEDLPENEVAIGYEEAYDLHGAERIENFEEGRKKLRNILVEAVQAADMKIIDGDRDGFIVRNDGIGRDFQVTLSEA